MSGPSGVGKSTLLSALFKRVPHLEFSVSATTRSARAGGATGRTTTLSQQRFEDLERGGELLESATVYGQSYGTPRAPVERSLKEGRSIILYIDVQGRSRCVSDSPRR